MIKLRRENKPVFVFEIAADVTDINGETRSATTEVKVGYHAITATINAPATVDLVKSDNTIALTTENLNGQFVGVSGKVEIFKLHGTRCADTCTAMGGSRSSIVK